jgi:DNA-binding NarL/FixJ family response regulator
MRKIRTVIIEDEPLARMTICTALKQTDDIELVGDAPNARHGLMMLKNLQPDVAIIDIGLPDQDGIELTRTIKAKIGDRQLLNTKVLILTLNGNKEAVLSAFSAGADSYCMKDTQLDKLLEAVRVTADGNPWIDPMIARIILEKAQQKIYPIQSDHKSPLNAGNLTDRQLEVLKLIVEGYSNGKIAERLNIKTGTVKTHVQNIMNKLSADDRTQAAIIALRSGLVA